MTTKKKTMSRPHIFSPAEQRAARGARIKVREAEPYGWIAYSESSTEQAYHLFCDPATKHLACTCADFIYRGNAEPGFECKHVTAVLMFIARCFLLYEYESPQHMVRAA